jgi:hypothetical protein
MDMIGAILLAVIGVVIGFLLGALVFSLRRESPPQPDSRKSVLSDSQEDLRIWREGKDEQLVIEMEGATYRRESDLDPDQSRRLTRLINELRTFMGVLSTTPIQTPGAQTDSLPRVQAPAAQTDSLKPAVIQTAADENRTSRNPFQIFARSLRPLEKSGADEPDKSIVAQIDEILQTRLENTPLADQGIHLIEGPDQGMVIEVGLSRYTDIDEIPEAEIRGLIRQAVSEWESRTAE